MTRDEKEELYITTSTLIDRLRKFPLPIHGEILIYRPLKPLPLMTIEDLAEFKPVRYTRNVDLKEYIIRALEYMDKSINEAENRAREAERKLDEYKRECREFEMFRRFKNEKGMV